MQPSPYSISLLLCNDFLNFMKTLLGNFESHKTIEIRRILFYLLSWAGFELFCAPLNTNPWYLL